MPPLRDVARPVHLARVDQENLEVPIGLPVDGGEHFGQPAFFVECSNDDARFRRLSPRLIVPARGTDR